MYMGGDGLYTPTFIYEKSDLCVVFSDDATTRTMHIPAAQTLQEFISMLSTTPSLQLTKPSIIGESTSLYMQKPPSLEQALRGNLSKQLSDLVKDGEVLTITDPTLRDISLSVQINFEALE